MKTHSGFQVLDSLASIPASDWDTLAGNHPLLSHAFLHALHETGCASAETGWAPCYLTLWRHGRIAAAMPLYLKSHSYGEYVFDWAWADAYRRHGLRYYPKLLDAVPFTPVPGPRLLARSAADRRLLVLAIEQLARTADLSSAHLLFLDDDDQEAARAGGWMMRSTVQFHWTNRPSAPYVDFADFLASLQRDKRKKIQQERRRVVEAGVTFEERCGGEISTSDWDFFYRCYTLTYRAHHSTPYLTRDFFERMGRTMAENWLMFIAS